MKRRSKTRKGGGVFSSDQENKESYFNQLTGLIPEMPKIPYISSSEPTVGGRRRHRKSIKRIFGFKLQMPKLFSKTRKHRRRYSRKR